MRTIHFNTGRRYTAQGQRITATIHADERVTFCDHDRHIVGELNHIPAGFTQLHIMEAYDAGAWSNTTRAWEDGMMRGGCNAKWEG